jgi:Protein of unknown function (DUF1656)
MKQIPHEFVLGDVYLSPLLIAAFLGAIAAYVTIQLLYRYRLTHYFIYPPLVSLSLMIIYTIFIGTFIIGT